MRHPKRRTEYLLRRLVVKHAVAIVTGRSTEPEALAAIEVGNAPDGCPYVLVDGAPLGQDVSITDRAGWAVCVLGPAVGCDLELVEPRSPAFLRDFLTEAERRSVDAQPAGNERDATANLIWSAKESALKALRTGLRRDTRSVEVTVDPGFDTAIGTTTTITSSGWGPLAVHGTEGVLLPGWWRRDGRFLLTVVAATPGPPPGAIEDATALASAVPRHSWLDRPLPR
jgi:4'-phosphopantetheinyl transferase